MVLPVPDTHHPQPLLPFPLEQQALTAAWGARKHEASSSRGRTCVQHGGGKSSAPPPSCEKPPPCIPLPTPQAMGQGQPPGQQHFKQGFPSLAAELLTQAEAALSLHQTATQTPTSLQTPGQRS